MPKKKNWCERAANQQTGSGEGWNVYWLGLMLMSGLGGERDLGRAEELCQRALTTKGDNLPPRSFCLSAIRALKGETIPLRYAEDDTLEPVPSGQTDYTVEEVAEAKKYQKEKMWQKAHVLYQELGRKGYGVRTTSCIYYFEAPRIEYYAGSVLKWCTAAANINDSISESRLGLIYAFGVGVPQDFTEAERHCNRAVQLSLHFRSGGEFCLAAIESMRALKQQENANSSDLHQIDFKTK